MLTQTKVYLYNGEGELAETALYNGEVSAANEQQRYRYEYDSLGRVICSQEITNGALQQGTETLYDDANRVKKQSWSLFQTEDGKTTTKTYTGRYTYTFGAALPLAPVVAVIAISLAVVAAYQGYRIYAARHRSHGKKGVQS